MLACHVMDMLLCISFVELAGAFAVGGWLMLGALKSEPGVRIHCSKCGNDLTETDSLFCPKCRRMLSPEMRIRCTRSTIAFGRLTAGGLVVAVAAWLTVWLMLPSGGAG